MNARKFVSAIAVAAVALAATTGTAHAAALKEPMHRLYNPYSGEHFYTASTVERDYLDGIGWIYEGVGWWTDGTGDPVYRLYNPYGGDHHYTVSAVERDWLVSLGWNYEGVGWRSSGTVAVLRQYNPYATSATHNYTTSSHENDCLVSLGWNAEGIGWYAQEPPSSEDDHVHQWRTETRTVKAAWDEPVYEDRPKYEMQWATLFSDGHIIWDEDYPWDGVGENKALIDATSEYMNRHYDETGEILSWGPTRLKREIGTERVQVDTVHHPAVTETVTSCALCGAKK